MLGLCELHGNTNLERCKKCGKEYLRDFRVRNAKKVKAHLTGELAQLAHTLSIAFTACHGFLLQEENAMTQVAKVL